MSACNSCGAILKNHWLKDGLCNGCKNPFSIVRGFSSLAEVSAELDRLDLVLGEKMKGFDENKSKREFESLMAECNHIQENMQGLYILEARLKRENAS